MAPDWIRKHCLSLPHTTETVQWGNDLVFKVGGKMYAVMALDPGPHVLSFKCSPEDFAELTERPGIIPAPYLARNAYDLVFAKLTKKAQKDLGN
jgi:predicted DNA-binding protein (MmcQ/YjbR family)